MPIELKCTHCGYPMELSETASGTTVQCPSCQKPVEVPPKESEASQSVTETVKQTDSSEVLGWTILGGLVGLVVLIAWLGWTTFITIVLWIVIVGSVLVGAGFGLVALDNPTKESKAHFVGVGAICAIVVVVAWDMIPSSKTSNPATKAPSATAPRLEEVIAASLQQAINQNVQQVFNGIHPVGTAKNAIVHDVSIVWKHGQRTNRVEDVQAYTARYTLYWEGPITKDGYTKVDATFDVESQRWTAIRILATNGVTNRDAGEAIGQIGGALLLEYLKDNQ